MKGFKHMTFTPAIQPTTVSIATASSSELVDMSQFSEYLAVVTHGAATTAGTATVSVWESSSPTWEGATPVHIFTTAAPVTTTTGRQILVNIQRRQLSGHRRYLGLHVQKADAPSGVSAYVVRDGDRYIP